MFKRMDLLYFLVSASFIERIEWVTKVFSCMYIYIYIYIPGYLRTRIRDVLDLEMDRSYVAGD